MILTLFRLTHTDVFFDITANNRQVLTTLYSIMRCAFEFK